MPVVRRQDLDFTAIPGRLAADPLTGLPDAAPASSVRVVQVHPGPRTPHRHPGSEEIFYVLGGSGTSWEGDRPTPIGPGDLVVLPPDAPHATVAGPEGLEVVAFFPHHDLAGQHRGARGSGPRLVNAH